MMNNSTKKTTKRNSNAKIKKLKNFYSFRIDVGYDPITRKRIQRTFSGYKSFEDAKAAYHFKVNEVIRNKYIAPSSVTMNDYLAAWLIKIQNSISLSTYEGYKVNVSQIASRKIGKIKLKDFQYNDAEVLYKELMRKNAEDVQEKDKKFEYKSTTVRYVHATLRKALSDAVEEGLITHNDLIGRKKAPKPERYEAKFLTSAQVETLLDLFADSAMFTPVMLCVGLGLRRGEALGLTWDCVDLSRGTVTIANSMSVKPNGAELSKLKTNASFRTLTVPAEVLACLLTQKEKQEKDRRYFKDKYQNSGLVCTNENGTLIHPRSLEGVFHRRVNSPKAFPGLRIHDLRHTNAALMLHDKIPMIVVKQRLGHASIRVTIDLYGHVYPEGQTEAALILDRSFQFLRKRKLIEPQDKTKNDEA